MIDKRTVRFLSHRKNNIYKKEDKKKYEAG